LAGLEKPKSRVGSIKPSSRTFVRRKIGSKPSRLEETVWRDHGHGSDCNETIGNDKARII